MNNKLIPFAIVSIAAGILGGSIVALKETEVKKECTKCHHIFATASGKQVDNNGEKQWYCAEHKPAWDIIKYGMFYKKCDVIQVTEEGKPVTYNMIYTNVVVTNSITWIYQ